MSNNAENGNSLACYGCVDFANNERTLAYYRWACQEGMFPDGCRPDILELCYCPADSPAQPWTNPVDDEVCWYDEAVPESSQFLGVIILNKPVKDSTVSREVGDGFLKGSVLNRLKRRGRAFTFEVLLLATSCEGMAYGKEWLRRLLEDAPCQNDASISCSSCFGRRLGVRVHCPTTEGAADDGLHEWFDVGAVDGLTEVEDDSGTRRCCCVLQRATFTMQSASPYSHSANPTVICEGVVDPDEDYVRCFDWTSDCFECCPPSGCDRCKYDPICSCFPFIVPDPQLPTDDCATCEPLARVFNCCCTEDLPGTYDTTFKIDVYSGFDVNNDEFMRAGMRDFRMRIWQNTRGLPCITDDESYETWCSITPCFEIAVNYIPVDSTLTIDGRTERLTITCDGICRPFQHRVTNTLGSLWPLETRCAPLMICSEFSYYSTQLAPEAPGVRPATVNVTSFLRFYN